MEGLLLASGCRWQGPVLRAAIATNQSRRSQAIAPLRAASSAYFARPQSVLIQRWIGGAVSIPGVED